MPVAEIDGVPVKFSLDEWMEYERRKGAAKAETANAVLATRDAIKSRAGEAGAAKWTATTATRLTKALKSQYVVVLNGLVRSEAGLTTEDLASMSGVKVKGMGSAMNMIKRRALTLGLPSPFTMVKEQDRTVTFHATAEFRAAAKDAGIG